MTKRKRKRPPTKSRPTSPPEEQIDQSTEAPPAAHEAEPGAKQTAAPAATLEEAETSRPSAITAEEMSYLEQLQRLQAEFTNYRRRIQKERAQWDARAKGEILTGLLPMLQGCQDSNGPIGA